MGNGEPQFLFFGKERFFPRSTHQMSTLTRLYDTTAPAAEESGKGEGTATASVDQSQFTTLLSPVELGSDEQRRSNEMAVGGATGRVCLASDIYVSQYSKMLITKMGRGSHACHLPSPEISARRAVKAGKA